MNIAFIPVRCGSDAIKLKNIKLFCGKPLVYWCLKALQDCEEIDKIYVATDCDKIEDVVQTFQFSKVEIYRRDAENATGTSGTESVMLEFISKNNFSPTTNFLLVQATNPFVTASDFSSALTSIRKSGYDSLLSCCRIKRFFWDENGTPINYNYKNRPLRQSFVGALVENGAFYINTIKNILTDKNRLSGNIGIHEMPEYSFTEIDEIEDWLVAEKIFIKNLLEDKTKQKIKILLTDVDGVLTDAGMYYTENGDEIKKFSAYDGMAFSILQNKGIKIGMITREERLLNARRAKKLKMDFTYQGIKNKLEILKTICESENIIPEDVAYIGDDINDLEILSHVGVAACPATARPEIKSIPGIIILNTPGGEGVIRELVDNHIEY